MNSPNNVEFENTIIIKQTDKAILVRFEDKEEPVWIPQSQVHDDSEVWIEGDKGKLVISEWIAKKNGLI